ncbi:hypothetical protein OUZ56_003105 [Daphnia magna]|uniref:Uncharacterized protein n=1 Tax=Daphnia magna TaxID=35525 RepID=A0ABR0A7S1_9CRUS|nr:hypothetical protein OUZ56_003105 [Daphnia magna]
MFRKRNVVVNDVLHRTRKDNREEKIKREEKKRHRLVFSFHSMERKNKERFGCAIPATSSWLLALGQSDSVCWISFNTLDDIVQLQNSIEDLPTRLSDRVDGF